MKLLLALLAGDDEEIPSKAVLQVLAVRKKKSKKMSVARVRKVPQQHHQHLIVLFVDFSCVRTQKKQPKFTS